MIRSLSLLCALAVSACVTVVVPKAADTATAAHTGMQPAASQAAAGTRAFDHKPQPGEVAICAVSGEKFLVTAETKVREHNGRWYAFCCDDCGPEFDKDPGSFAP